MNNLPGAMPGKFIEHPDFKVGYLSIETQVLTVAVQKIGQKF